MWSFYRQNYSSPTPPKTEAVLNSLVINILTVWLAEAYCRFILRGQQLKRRDAASSPQVSTPLICSTDTPANTLLLPGDEQRDVHESGDDSDMCRPPFYRSSITADLFSTQLNINTPPTLVVGNYPSLSEEVWLLQATSSIDKKTHKDTKQEHVNIIQRLPQSVLMSV